MKYADLIIPSNNENSGKSKLDYMLTSWNSLGGNNVSYSYTIYNILINLKVNITTYN